MLDPRVLAVLMILAGGYYVGEKVVEGIKVVDRGPDKIFIGIAEARAVIAKYGELTFNWLRYHGVQED